MSFESDMRRIAKKTQSTLDEVSRATIIALFNGVIRDTRVKSGRLRGNWQVSLGSPITRETDRLDPVSQGADGGAAQSEVNSTVSGDQVNYLTNNLDYAPVWEDRDGMIAKNMARIQRNVREAAREHQD